MIEYRCQEGVQLMKKYLHYLIFVSMILGGLIGSAMWGLDEDGALFGNLMVFFDFFGKTIFIGSLKMIVAPLIFFSIISAIVSLPTAGELWQIGWKCWGYGAELAKPGIQRRGWYRSEPTPNGRGLARFSAPTIGC